MTGVVCLTLEAGVARLCFEHERRLNAISAAMWRSLPGLLDEVEANPAIRVLLLEGRSPFLYAKPGFENPGFVCEGLPG
jgi:enoyl-CoA hydratase/carnithine racemase